LIFLGYVTIFIPPMVISLVHQTIPYWDQLIPVFMWTDWLHHLSLCMYTIGSMDERHEPTDPMNSTLPKQAHTEEKLYLYHGSKNQR
jgi:hypothetical protein